MGTFCRARKAITTYETFLCKVFGPSCRRGRSQVFWTKNAPSDPYSLLWRVRVRAQVPTGQVGLGETLRRQDRSHRDGNTRNDRLLRGRDCQLEKSRPLQEGGRRLR